MKRLFWAWSGIFGLIVALFFILSFISRDRIDEGRLEIKESKVLESSDFALENIESSSDFAKNANAKNIESNVTHSIESSDNFTKNFALAKNLQNLALRTYP